MVRVIHSRNVSVAVAALLTVALGGSYALAAKVRCPVVKDVWVSAVGKEVTHSMGKTDRLKLKVLQELALMSFDVSDLKGRQIVSAELYIHPAQTAGKVSAPQRGTDLRWIVLSTVSSRWVEGAQQKSYQPDPVGHGATFLEASSGRKPWCWRGSDLSHVINGHLNSLKSAGELQKAHGGYWKVPVDVKLVQALVAGLGDGLAVMDGSSTHRVNCFIFSREAKGKEPYLLVEVAGEQPQKPAAPQILSVEPDVSHATPQAGAIAIKVKTPPTAIGFHVQVDGKLMDAWQVELPKHPGGQDVIVIEDLEPGKSVRVAVRAVDAAGNVSPWSRATGKVSSSIEVPPLPAPRFVPKPAPPKKIGKDLAVWAFPEVVEVDPVRRVPLFEPKKGRFRLANAVWCGAEAKVRLAAARGEIAAFQLGLEHAGRPIDVRVALRLTGPDGYRIPAGNIRLYRVWYVRTKTGWNSEYVIPLKGGKVQVPSPDNKIGGQKLQAVYVDVVVPLDAPAGTYTGEISLRTPAGSGSLPVELVVYPVQIPVELNFNPELNCYGGPGRAGNEEFFAYHRLAHYNRCTLNRVPYSQNGSVHDDMIPKLAGSGAQARVVDWRDYDRRIGPLLDGSAFKGLPRDGVPVKTFYLPFFENWPMPLEGHYEMGFPKKMPNREQQDNLKDAHDLKVKPVEQAFDEAYKTGFKNIVRQFLKHYDQKGWTKTICEMYQNNKYNWAGTWWTLDEPHEWTDWAALGFFARMFHEAIGVPHKAQFLYRGDISRPQWQGAWMDGLMDIMYSGGRGLTWPRLLMHIKERTGMIIYLYGSCNPVDRNNLESAAWCLKAYAVGGDGVLPWQSLGNETALAKPIQTALLVPGKRFGVTAVASVRVLALRQGAQLCELLRMVQKKQGWTRFHAGVLTAQKVPLTADFKQRFEDEAAAATFGQLTGRGFVELKEGLLQMLSESRP